MSMSRWFLFSASLTLPLMAQVVKTPVPPTVKAPASETTRVETLGMSEEDTLEDLPSDSAAEASAPQTETPNSPQTYEIVRGDTLWDICKKILGDPWYWPKLWALNDYIANPHLIYPGNVIKFYAGSETAPPQLVIEGSGTKTESVESNVIEEPSQPDEVINVGKSLANVGTKQDVFRLRPVTFVMKKKPVPLGRISHSGMPKLELTFGETVYLEFSKKMKIAVGDKFHVIDYLQEVYDPDKTMHSYGWMVRKNAVLQITAITQTAIEAKIVSGDRSVRRGDVFVAYTPEIKEIKPFEGKKVIQGKIVAAENQQILIGQNEFAFLNVGKSSGIKEGMRFQVVKKGDGIFQGEDDHLPFVVIGNGVVAEVFDHTSTLYVSNLKETLEVGFLVRSSVQ